MSDYYDDNIKEQRTKSSSLYYSTSKNKIITIKSKHHQKTRDTSNVNINRKKNYRKFKENDNYIIEEDKIDISETTIDITNPTKNNLNDIINNKLTKLKENAEWVILD